MDLLIHSNYTYPRYLSKQFLTRYTFLLLCIWKDLLQSFHGTISIQALNNGWLSYCSSRFAKDKSQSSTCVLTSFPWLWTSQIHVYDRYCSSTTSVQKTLLIVPANSYQGQFLSFSFLDMDLIYVRTIKYLMLWKPGLNPDSLTQFK